MTTVQSVLPPAGGLLAEALPAPHFVDAYRVAWPAGPASRADEAACALLGRGPGWVRGLLRLRDALVRPLRLRTFPPQPAPPTLPLVAGSHFGPFRVVTVLPREVLLGQDDRLLDFRVSVRLEAGGGAVVTTAVRCHNALGRLYFALIRPFHRRIVPALLRAGLRPA
jgi:hypothetical protein